MQRQDSNLRPPGYELLKSVFCVPTQRLLGLFQGKPGGRSPLRTTLSTLCYPRIGQRMGQNIFCRQMVSIDIIWRQLIIRSKQIKDSPKSVGELRWIHRIPCKSIGAGIKQRKVHFRCLGGAEILVGAGILHLIKCIPEHLVMGFLPLS